MGGGGRNDYAQQAAAERQARAQEEELAIAREKNARENEQYAAIKPYAFDRLNNGLPFFGAMMDNTMGIVPRSFAPMKAEVMRRFSSQQGLPSGAREQALENVDEAQARAYDDALVNNLFANEQAKSEAARLITQQQQIANPAQWYGLANNANSSIMQMPVQQKQSGMAGILGGLTSGVGGALISKIPF